MARRSRGSFGFRQQGPESQHFAEDRGGLGERQRRRGHQRAIGRRQNLMHAMAEFVGQRHHVARLALVIEQHIRMHGRARSDGRRRPAPCRAAPARRSTGGRRIAGRFPPFPARRRHRRRARRRAPATSHRPPSARRAEARCGPNGAAFPCRTSWPSAGNSGATGADRRRAPPRPWRSPLPARRGWRDGARRRRP